MESWLREKRERDDVSIISERNAWIKHIKGWGKTDCLISLIHQLKQSKHGISSSWCCRGEQLFVGHAVGRQVGVCSDLFLSHNENTTLRSANRTPCSRCIHIADCVYLEIWWGVCFQHGPFSISAPSQSDCFHLIVKWLNCVRSVSMICYYGCIQYVLLNTTVCISNSPLQSPSSAVTSRGLL